MVWPWYWPEGNNNPKAEAEGHYGCPKVNTKTIPLQASINVFIPKHNLQWKTRPLDL